MRRTQKHGNAQTIELWNWIRSLKDNTPALMSKIKA